MRYLENDRKWAVGGLARPLPAVSGTTPCGQVFEMMQESGADAGLAVVEDDWLIGLAGRNHLMKNFAHPVTYALYENRPISLLMRRNPLVVEATTPIERVSELIATEKVSALEEGFVVVDNGRYRGIGTIPDLLNLSVRKAREQIGELETARAEAERASKAKSSFLANLSHELRTPMNAIMGFSELIASGAVGEVNAKQAEYLRDVQTSAKRLLDLINDLLDLSRAEAGRLELEATPTDLGGLIHEACRILMLRARDKGVSLEYDLPEVARAQVDERKMLQVVLNLVTNAVKFTPEGGRVHVQVDGEATGGCRIDVTDSGVGIAEADLARVFEPFSRGRGDYTRHSEGSGIGLALVKVLVNLHGGEIALDSELGVGTRVSVHLPPHRVVALKWRACQPA